MKQTILTFVTEVDPARVSELARILDEIAADLAGNRYILFARLKSLHFASFVLHEDADYGPRLIFENNFDGTLDVYLEELYRNAAQGLHQIYACCLDYPASSAANHGAILRYLKEHVVRPSAHHIGNPGRSAERIAHESELHERIELLLDGLVGSNGASASLAVHERIADEIRRDVRLAALALPEPRLTLAERILPWANIAAVSLAALVLSPVLVPALVVYTIALRRKELRDAVHGDMADPHHVRELVVEEDRTPLVQNHMTSITNVKRGVFRRATLRAVLWIVNLRARTCTHGSLAGIPSIHFAHWSLIDGGRRLMFLSNYDGSWESYLGDFIEKASPGLTAIWSNTVEFPATKFLFFGGAHDGPRFKAIVRDKQNRTNVWYSAYPRLTVGAIDNQSAIREDLFRPLDEAAAREWLARF